MRTFGISLLVVLIPGLFPSLDPGVTAQIEANIRAADSLKNMECVVDQQIARARQRSEVRNLGTGALKPASYATFFATPSYPVAVAFGVQFADTAATEVPTVPSAQPGTIRQ